MQKEYGIPSVRSLLGDQGRIAPVGDFPWFAFSALSCLQYFNTVGWVTGSAYHP